MQNTKNDPKDHCEDSDEGILDYMFPEGMDDGFDVDDFFGDDD